MPRFSYASFAHTIGRIVQVMQSDDRPKWKRFNTSHETLEPFVYLLKEKWWRIKNDKCWHKKTIAALNESFEWRSVDLGLNDSDRRCAAIQNRLCLTNAFRYTHTHTIPLHGVSECSNNILLPTCESRIEFLPYPLIKYVFLLHHRLKLSWLFVCVD